MKTVEHVPVKGAPPDARPWQVIKVDTGCYTVSWTPETRWGKKSRSIHEIPVSEILATFAQTVFLALTKK